MLFASSIKVESAGDSDVVRVAGRVAAYKRSPIRRSKTSRTTSMAESSGRLRAVVLRERLLTDSSKRNIAKDVQSVVVSCSSVCTDGEQGGEDSFYFVSGGALALNAAGTTNIREGIAPISVWLGITPERNFGIRPSPGVACLCGAVCHITPGSPSPASFVLIDSPKQKLRTHPSCCCLLHVINSHEWA